MPRAAASPRTGRRRLPARGGATPAQQTWPWLNQIASTTPSTAASRSASSKTMKGDLPPSSSVSDLPEPAVCSRMMRPTSVEPVKAILSMPAWSTIAAPVAPSPVTMLTTPSGRPHLGADLGEGERGQRRVFGRLQHHRVAGGQRRRDLPGQHQQREVPRDDLAADADRRRGRGTRRPAARPSRRGGRSAGRPAACRCRGSRGSACRCRGFPAPRGSRACFCMCRAMRIEIARPLVPGQRGPAGSAPCAPPSPPLSTSCGRCPARRAPGPRRWPGSLTSKRLARLR